MAGLPTPPRTPQGELDATVVSVMAELHSGILAACCVCQHSSSFWWRHDREYHPLHERCVDRLIELWGQMGASGAAAPQVTRRTGAYARRAAVSAEPAAVARAVSVDLGSPFFRPGMPQGAPWTACALTMTGVSFVPCGLNEDFARTTVNRWAILMQQGAPGGPRDTMIAGCSLVGPDGTVHVANGQVPPLPGEPLPWEPITQRAEWATCAGCQARLWPGRWRGQESGRCLDCLRVISPRPSWPADGDCLVQDPLTVPRVSARRREKERIVD